MQSSEISDIGSAYVAKGITSDETEVHVIDSRILGIYGFEVAGAIYANRALEVADTLIRESAASTAIRISSGGDAAITGTTVDGVSGLGVTAITARGTLTLSNSTISGISGERYSGGVVASDTAHGTITNVTIAGNSSQDDSSYHEIALLPDSWSRTAQKCDCRTA